MAWLQGLAGKAETLLNRMDQTAADTLHASGTPNSPRTFGSSSDLVSRAYSSSHRRANSNTSATSDIGTGFTTKLNELHDPSDTSIRRSASHHNVVPSGAAEYFAKQKSLSYELDSDLLNFLNNSGSDQDTPRELIHARNNSRQSLIVSQESVVAKVEDEQASDFGLVYGGSTEALDEIPMQREAINRENAFLKTELQGLRREFSMALARAKRAEQDLQKLINQTSTDRQKGVTENNSREADFMNALKSKDSQIAVLRVHLEQVESDKKSSHARLADSEENAIRLHAEFEDFKSRNSQSVNTLHDLTEFRSLHNREKEQAVVLQDQLTAELRVIQQQNAELSGTVNKLERALVTEKESMENLRSQMNQVMVDSGVARQELLDYKQKAHKILLSKDELISSLKATDGTVTDEATSLEMEEIQQERNLLRDELISLQTNLEIITKQLQENEIQHRRDITQLRERCDGFEGEVQEGHGKLKNAEFSLQSRNEELQSLETDLKEKERSFQLRLKDRDSELVRLRQQFLTRSEARPSEEELESRLRVLTENLIQKQTTIETLNTEKGALVAQMERLERRLRSAGNTLEESRITITPNVTETFQNRMPGFLLESSGDNEVAKRFKRVYSTVDRFSFRLGTFLRRYPLARVMVIGYMMLLHFWVLVVLLTYTPEIHSNKPDK